MNFTKLTKEEQLTILANVAENKGIVDNAVEKDYGSVWYYVLYFLCRMLQLLYSKAGQALAKDGD